jgi:hypothetical protein
MATMDLNQLSFEEFEEVLRQRFFDGASEEFVFQTLRFVSSAARGPKRELGIRYLSFHAADRPPVSKFLGSVLDQPRWSTVERGVALEGLLGVWPTGPLLAWVAEHPDPEFFETAIMNTDPGDWGELGERFRFDRRIAPLNKIALGDLARQVEQGVSRREV